MSFVTKLISVTVEGTFVTKRSKNFEVDGHEIRLESSISPVPSKTYLGTKRTETVKDNKLLCV